MYTENPALIELLHRVLRDNLPTQKADAAVLYAQTKNHEMAQLEQLANLYKYRVVSKLAISGYEGCNNGQFIVSGFYYWKKTLENFGIPTTDILGFPLSTELPPCTDADAKGFVRFAKNRGWESAVVVVPPLHAVRAFVSTVTPVIREYPKLRVYSCPSETPLWTEKTLHSQSAPEDSGANLIKTEFAKLETYFKKGNHLSKEKVIEYLNQRDA